jgi:hypothetical protein
MKPIPLAARSKAWVCHRSFAGIAGSNPTGGHGMSLLSVVCCQVEVSATGRFLVQRSHAECGVFNWVWPQNFDNEGALAHLGLPRHVWIKIREELLNAPPVFCRSERMFLRRLEIFTYWTQVCTTCDTEMWLKSLSQCSTGRMRRVKGKKERKERGEGRR